MSEEPDTPPGQLSAKNANKIVGWLSGCVPLWLLVFVPLVLLIVK